MDSQTPKTRRYGKQIGHSGTSIFSGIITSEEYNNRLRGKQGLRQYEIMRRSSESVRAALQLVKLPLLSVGRRIEPASDDPQDIYIADFVNQQLFKNPKLNFNKMLKEASTFLEFGHSLAEKTYNLTEFEGQIRIGIENVSFRKQTTVDSWLTEDKKPGITQRVTSEGVDNVVSIPRDKLIVWTHDQEGDNYEGISILRYAFASWDMYDKLRLIHIIALEKAGVPTPVVKIPSSASADDENSAIEAIQQFRSNEKAYIKIPQGWELDKFDLSGQSVSELLPALQHYQNNILLSVLGQFLLLGMNSGSGSRAVSEDHSKLFMQSEEAVNKMLMDAIQEQLINQLCDLNFTNLPNGYPQLVSEPIKEDNLTELADTVTKFKQAGVFTPTIETENYLRKVARLPELPEDYEKDYEAKREIALNPADSTPTGKPGDVTNTDKTIEKEAKTKAAVRAAKIAQDKLIDVLVS